MLTDMTLLNHKCLFRNLQNCKPAVTASRTAFLGHVPLNKAEHVMGQCKPSIITITLNEAERLLRLLQDLSAQT